MAPKKNTKGKSKEDLDRIAREQEEAVLLQELLVREKEAEERQRKENDRRDVDEEEERTRIKKEEQQRLLYEKDHRILMLTTEVNTQRALFASERVELESELERMLRLKEALLNELSDLRIESSEIQRKLLEERAQLSKDCDSHKSALSRALSVHKETSEDLQAKWETLHKQFDATRSEIAELQSTKERTEREHLGKVRAVERELEKATGLNKTLRDVVEAREADDRRNITLMQLLTSQLDDSKRRAQEMLEDERQRTVAVRQELMRHETLLRQSKEENDLLQHEKDALKRQNEIDVKEQREKTEQMQFDLKYLHSELHSYKTQFAKHQQEASAVRLTATTETQSMRLELEAHQKKADEMEALLRRKDREHFDKTTFLNAQIANNRVIIQQLQQKLTKERDERAGELAAAQAEVAQKSLAMQTMRTDLEKRQLTTQEQESKLHADVSILKTTVFHLQSALSEKEKQVDVVRATYEEQVRRLKSKLDEHFIPHRADADGIMVADKGLTVETVLQDKLAKLQRDTDIRQRVSLETETRLKAQITNQNQMIDALQSELHRAKSDWGIEVKSLREENARLRSTLELHFIPVPSS